MTVHAEKFRTLTVKGLHGAKHTVVSAPLAHDLQCKLNGDRIKRLLKVIRQPPCMFAISLSKGDLLTCVVSQDFGRGPLGNPYVLSLDQKGNHLETSIRRLTPATDDKWPKGQQWACNPQGRGWKGKGLWAQTADEIDSLKLGEINDLALEMLPILTHKGSKGRLTTMMQ